jgi:hypothetical protein
MTIDSSIVPLKLFKYLSYKCHSIENLKKRQIYFPTPSKLNDPFDCAVPFNLTDSDDEELENGFQFLVTPLKEKDVLANQYLTSGKPDERLNKDFMTLAKKVNDIQLNYFQKMGVACFSDPISKKPDNILLWSHYADGHKGFCLEFDTGYYPFQESSIDLQKVNYRMEFPSTSSVLAAMGGKIWIEPLISKSNEWCYEDEWRLIVEKGDSFLYYEPRALTAVYFGCLMPKDQKNEIAQILKNAPTNCYEMIRSKTTYSIEVKK